MRKKGTLLFVSVIFALILVGSLASDTRAAEAPIICKFQHAIPPGQTGMVDVAEILGYFIEKESNGRIKMKYHPGGAIVGTAQIWDGVNGGSIDATVACTCYTMGKSFASSYFCNAPGSLGIFPKMLWYYEGGGYELAKKLLYKHYKNITMFPGGWMLTEPWLYCNKEINTLADLKGLKVRASGARAKVYTKLGMSAIGMAQGEIMPAMERKVIDGFELASFYGDLGLRIADSAKYVYLGNKFQEGGVSFAIFNNKWFASLPDDLKKAVESACRHSMFHNVAYAAYMEAKSLHDADKQKTINVRIFSDEIQDALFTAAMEVISETIKAGDEEMKEFWVSQSTFYQEWTKFIESSGHTTQWHYPWKLVPEGLKKLQ